MNENETLLRCIDLDVEVAGRVIVRGLNFSVQRGQCWCLLGRNGTGKTTLLHTLAGLRSPCAGQVLLGNTPLTELRRRQIARRLGILFQEHTDNFPATVEEKVLLRIK